jgi:hypothetical protein
MGDVIGFSLYGKMFGIGFETFEVQELDNCNPLNFTFCVCWWFILCMCLFPCNDGIKTYNKN